MLTFDIACFRGGMMGRPPPLMGRGMMYRDPGFGRGGMRPRMGFPPGYGRGGMRYQGVCWQLTSVNSRFFSRVNFGQLWDGNIVAT